MISAGTLSPLLVESHPTWFIAGCFEAEGQAPKVNVISLGNFIFVPETSKSILSEESRVPNRLAGWPGNRTASSASSCALRNQPRKLQRYVQSSSVDSTENTGWGAFA